MEGPDKHYLFPLLIKSLPKLGLDVDTYIPYVVGYTEVDALEENDDALDEVIELLRASSETHSDLNEPWTELKNDIIRTRNEYKESQLLKQEEENLKRLSGATHLESLIINKGNEEEIEKSSESSRKEEKQMDDVKRALIQKYAYDESVLFDDEGNEIANNLNGEEDEYINNRQLAQQRHLENMQQLRSAHNQNKKEEREKTKLAKLEKNKQKEDRRLRAQKGERRA